MKHMNYFPWPHQGISLKMSTCIDKRRIYSSELALTVAPIFLISDYNYAGRDFAVAGEYLVLKANEDIDYDIIISLN
jgi:hypothetical protein